MIRFSSLDDIQLQEAWLTIGIFDGVHLGHRALIQRLVDGAHAAGSQAVLMTFHPHLAVVLGSSLEFKFLSTADEKADLLESLGVDVLITDRYLDMVALLDGG